MGVSPARPRPAVRDDLRALEGYHSPQVDVRVRLNTNESPEPPPQAWRDELAAAVASVAWHRYPDRTARRLRAAIAASHGVRPEQVFAGNGSNEVLQVLCLAYGGAGRTAAVFEPTYQLHAHIARIAGTSVVAGRRGPGFVLDLDEVHRVLAEHAPALTFLCSPNNPTGVVDEPASVEGVAAAAPGVVVVDEAYGQFAPWSALALVDDERPLVVVRTFSKTWSMAGTRLGYLVGPTWLVEELDKVVLPYHLDTAKQLAGELALRHADDMAERVRRLVAERERLVAGLDRLPVEHWPSGANFVLFRPLARHGREVWEGLLERSVLVRDCSSWEGLEGCLRVTVGTPAEDDAFLAALDEVLS